MSQLYEEKKQTIIFYGDNVLCYYADNSYATSICGGGDTDGVIYP